MKVRSSRTIGKEGNDDVREDSLLHVILRLSLLLLLLFSISPSKSRDSQASNKKQKETPTRQAVVADRFLHIIHQATHAAVAHDQLRQLGRVLGDLTNDRRRVLADQIVRELEAGEDLGEDLRLDDDLGQVHRVLGDLGQGAAHLALELGVLIEWTSTKKVLKTRVILLGAIQKSLKTRCLHK